MSPNTNKLTLLAFAAVIIGSSAFSISPAFGPLSLTRVSAENNDDAGEKVSLPNLADNNEEQAAPAPEKKAAPTATKKEKGKNEGIFSPVVYAGYEVLGDKEIKKMRGKFIAKHADIISKFVKTSESEFGASVLRSLFELCDKDGNGSIDKEELQGGLSSLGFSWIDEKKIEQIFKRADADSNGMLDVDEWIIEAPKTLKTNLIKLAKTNGHDMGFLV